MLLSLSWKNIWRNKTRSLVIIFAIVFGIIGGVGFVAFFNGLIFQRIELAIGNETSNIQIHNANFQSNKEINDTISNLITIYQTLDTCKKIKAYSSRLKGVAMINSANSGEGIMLSGIEPESEKTVTNIYHCIVAGNYFNTNKKNGIVIGQKLADKLKIKLRSKVVITMQTTSGNITTAAFKVVGIYKTNNSTFDNRNAYVDKAYLASILGFDSDVCHEIAISVNNDKIADNLAKNISTQINNNQVSVQYWKEIMPELSIYTDVAEYMLYIFMTIIFLALSFGIINTMLMAVLDRVREIGMLMAIGMNKRKIFKMIMLETIMLMLTGSIIGMFLSYFLINYLKTHGIDLSNFSKGLSGLGFSTMVYPFLEIQEYIKIIIMVVITGILSSIIPARRALKLNPSEAIRKL
jgi:putative ABC transport system permease protein